MADTQFIGADGDPKPVCANCDCYASALKRCINRTSIWFTFNPQPHDGCERFFPDAKRWPDYDHD